jgi:hypothetical protein
MEKGEKIELAETKVEPSDAKDEPSDSKGGSVELPDTSQVLERLRAILSTVNLDETTGERAVLLC